MIEERLTGNIKRLEESLNGPGKQLEEVWFGLERKIAKVLALPSTTAEEVLLSELSEALEPSEESASTRGSGFAQRPEAVDRSQKTQTEIDFSKGLAQRKPEGSRRIKLFRPSPAAPPVAPDLSIQNQLDEIKTRLLSQEGKTAEVLAAVEEGNGKTDELVGHLTTSVIYLHFDWRDGYFKIGYSNNYEKPSSGRKGKGRKDTHESMGLEYVAHVPALQIEETKFKNLMKELHSQRDDDLFKPKRKSNWEEFKASKEFIGVLKAYGWPGADQDLERFLKNHRQRELDV